MIKIFKDEYAFLSNFFEREVVFNGIKYLNNEAAFQSMKTLDIEIRKTFSNLTASEAKKKGRKITLRPDWEDVKFDYMYLICKAKFTQNLDLKIQLFATRGKELIEGTTGWHDNIWGNCECPKCKDIIGQNHLGKILMRIREELFFEDMLLAETNMAKDLILNNKIENMVCFFEDKSYDDELLQKFQIEFMREMGYFLFSNNLTNYVCTKNNNGIVIATKEYFEQHLINETSKMYISKVENL